VTLAVGEHVRGPRVYRGADIHWWMEGAGVLDERYDEVDDIVRELREAASTAEPMQLFVRRYRETRSVGMVTFDDEDGAAGRLAADLHARLARLGVYEAEKRPWLPHLTVLRFRRPPRLRPELPSVPPFSPSDAALYHSVLRSGGAQYEVVQSVALGS